MTTVKDLSQYDIWFALDKSGSMGDKDSSTGGKTRWQVAQETIVGLARVATEIDEDGITVVAFSSKRPDEQFKVYDNVTESKVAEIFKECKPNGGTDTAGVLKQIFDDYFEKKAKSPSETKPRIILVYTDGEPNDRDAVKKVIVEATKKMKDDKELGVSFIQAGNEPGVSKFLEELDDELVPRYKAQFDIVDTIKADDVAKLDDPAQVFIKALDD